MNTKHFISILALLALVAAVIGVRWSASEATPAHRVAERPVAPQAGTRSAALAGNPPIVAESAPHAIGRILSPKEFAMRFSLSGTEAYKLRNSYFASATDLQEMRGANALVQSFDGKILKLALPALRLTNEELETTVLGNIASAIGADKTASVWLDADGRATVLAQIGMDQVSQAANYEFVLTSPENDPSANLSLGYAKFDVTWSYAAQTEGNSPRLPTQSYKGFTFADTANIGLGWNALSKAPAGYFRSEPIAGVASRPQGGPTVVEDRKTGETEVLNLKRPGSVDSLPRG